MKKLTFLVYSILILGLMAACSSDKKTAQTSQAISTDVPELLDRHAALQHGKEWDAVQNKYAEQLARLRAKPEALMPHLELALLFSNEARITGEHGHYYPAALGQIDAILAKAPLEDKDLEFRALAAKASVELSLHHFEEALVTGKKAVAMNPYNSFVYGVLVDAHVELGQYDEAVKMADKMVSIRPDLRSYARISYLREIHGDVEGAIEAMKLAVAAGYPGMEQTSWTRLTLGNLYKMYGYEKEAEYEYTMALEERPDYPFAIAALGEMALERKDYEKAESLLKEAGAIIPEFGFFETMALMRKEQGETQKVEDLKAEILEMLADDIANGHNMNLEYANLYATLFDDYEKALTYVNKEYEKRPMNIDVNRMMANYYQKMGDTEKAAFHYEKASRTNSKHPELKELKAQMASL